MLLFFSKSTTKQTQEMILDALRRSGKKGFVFDLGEETVLSIEGVSIAMDDLMARLPEKPVRVIETAKKYQAVCREALPTGTHVSVGSETIGSGNVTLIAGPCALEDRKQAEAVATVLAEEGIRFFRAGVFKPRTSPYSFQGLGEEGLELLKEIKKAFGLFLVSEALDEHCLEKMLPVVDIVQIGSRNMQNFSLLKELGRCGLPVLLKRGMAATLDEFLMAAEYIVTGGNSRVILCERGIRTFGDHSRNTLDLSAVPYLKRETHLPVVVDPSHATGCAFMVRPLARAAVAAGADGIMVEVHPDPTVALSDGPQSIDLAEFRLLVHELKAVSSAVGSFLSQYFSSLS